jgi:hypothetical protein
MGFHMKAQIWFLGFGREMSGREMSRLELGLGL